MNPCTVKYVRISLKNQPISPFDRGWVVQEALDEMEKSPLFVVEKQNSAKIWCYYCMVQCIQCNLEQRCFWFWRGSVCSGCLSILSHLLIFHVFFSFSISRKANFAVHLKRLPGSFLFRLLIFNVFHFCVYNVCCKFAAVAQCPDHFYFTSWHFMFSSLTFSNVCNNLIFVDPFHPTYSTQSTHRVNDKQSSCPLI